MDTVKVAIIVNVVAIIFAIVAGGIVAWENVTSRNLVLGWAALAGTAFLFLFQLPLELRRSITTHSINAEFTIDRLERQIRQWEYSKAAWREFAELGATAWLTSQNPGAFERDREKLTVDFAIFSLLSFLTHKEFDWQLSTSDYKSKSGNIVVAAKPISRPDECTEFKETDLRALLKKAGNLLAEAPLSITSGKLCLPPKTEIDISTNSLVIRTPICQLSFNAHLAGYVDYTKPRSREMPPQLPSGGAQFETRLVSFRVENMFFALRAHHRESGKLREWSSRLLSRAQEWFES
jgi:hypothetical protein